MVVLSFKELSAMPSSSYKGSKIIPTSTPWKANNLAHSLLTLFGVKISQNTDVCHSTDLWHFAEAAAKAACFITIGASIEPTFASPSGIACCPRKEYFVSQFLLIPMAKLPAHAPNTMEKSELGALLTAPPCICSDSNALLHNAKPNNPVIRLKCGKTAWNFTQML